MESKPQFKAVDITGADYARDFPLPDADGRMRSIKDFAGKVVVLFFGYTQCPDVCPTTLAEIAQARKLLGADGDKVQGVFITVDPEHGHLPRANADDVVGAGSARVRFRQQGRCSLPSPSTRSATRRKC
jgi:cytochrome oxidase Cu insertion factor (SCO1/SenC/PrrC family)